MSSESARNAESEEIGRRLAEACLADTHGTVVSAYLFGSRARDGAHRESDVDVGVLLRHESVPSERGRFEERLRLSNVFARALGRNDVDVVILNDAPPGLGRHVVTEGRQLFCGESEIDRAFVRDVQLRAADVDPFLRRMRKLKLEVIGR